MVHLYNFQTSHIGINQIMNCFCDNAVHFGHENGIAPEANNHQVTGSKPGALLRIVGLLVLGCISLYD